MKEILVPHHLEDVKNFMVEKSEVFVKGIDKGLKNLD
jgi:hypothetical protein